MKPVPFRYVAASSAEEAVARLAEHGDDAMILAGGQSLLPLLNLRLARPSVLVDVSRIAELDYVVESDGALEIGAVTRKRTVEHSPLVRERHPLLHTATGLIGHAPIRSRGTVGGSLVQADPAAEYPALAVALGATLRVRGAGTTRTIVADDFFQGFLATALEPGEILAAVRWPLLPSRSGWSCLEFARRPGDFALAGVVASVSLDDTGRYCDARLVPFGVGPRPVRARAAEAALAGERPGESLHLRAAERVAAELGPPQSDAHASSEYRAHLTRVLVQRALAEAAARATSSRGRAPGV
ncbi:MAG: xanthine dehydrogenase family protein subunit M [Deltaproteobacteria bacterium]|nr:xanthine dehydrogenase family protein subunit M [Deltaproteobacteria bacterium]